MIRKLWPWLRKILVIAVGFPLLALGLVMIPLPGPGLPIVVGGLVILSMEFEWARRHLAFTRSKFNAVMVSFNERTAKVRRRVMGRWRNLRG